MDENLDGPRLLFTNSCRIFLPDISPLDKFPWTSLLDVIPHPHIIKRFWIWGKCSGGDVQGGLVGECGLLYTLIL